MKSSYSKKIEILQNPHRDILMSGDFTTQKCQDVTRADVEKTNLFSQNLYKF